MTINPANHVQSARLIFHLGIGKGSRNIGVLIVIIAPKWPIKEMEGY